MGPMGLGPHPPGPGRKCCLGCRPWTCAEGMVSETQRPGAGGAGLHAAVRTQSTTLRSFRNPGHRADRWLREGSTRTPHSRGLGFAKAAMRRECPKDPRGPTHSCQCCPWCCPRCRSPQRSLPTAAGPQSCPRLPPGPAACRSGSECPRLGKEMGGTESPLGPH